jgi:phage terminase small subunit
LHQRLSRDEQKERLNNNYGGLTLKERRLVEEYLIDLDLKRAVNASGFYSGKTHQNYYKVLEKPHIKAAIEQRKKELQKELGVDQGRMVKEYLSIAHAQFPSYCTIDEDGYTKFKQWEELTDEQKAAIAEVAFGKDKDGRRYITRIKLFDKMRALEGIAKHLGFFERDNKQKSEIKVTIEQVLDELPEAVKDLVRNRMINMTGNEEESANARMLGEGPETLH